MEYGATSDPQTHGHPNSCHTCHAGLLALRTTAIAGTFAIATAVAARIDVAHAAGHQICLQLWLASSLLADALAVAAQALVARLMAAQQLSDAQASLALLCILSSCVDKAVACRPDEAAHASL